MTPARRILSVWLPHWPVTRLRRITQQAAEAARSSGGAPARAASVSPDSLLVTAKTVRGVRLVAAVDAQGEAAGLRAGQTLTNARALCPNLDVVEADPGADERALSALVAWCERYTPLAAPDLPEGLWLDLTGCAHLFGGEAALMQDLAHRLWRSGIPCRMAVAGTTGVAWAVARFSLSANSLSVNTGQNGKASTEPRLVPSGGERAALARLPPASLRLDHRTVAGLRRLGIRTVAELARLPRSDITARFGPLPVLRLDQAFGDAEEAIAWPHPPLPWSERLAFAEPIGAPEDLARVISLLAHRLCACLAEKDQGGTRFAVRFHLVDEDIKRIVVTTALPSRDPAFLAKLFCEKLETVDPGYGIEVMTLDAEKTGPLGTPQEKLPSVAGRAGRDEGAEIVRTLDVLANRVGPGRIWRVAPQESHVPERAVKRIAPVPVAKQPAWVADPAAPRPIRLLRRPEPIEATAPVPDDPPILFRWRGAVHRVRAAAGPERISAEWWRSKLCEDEQAEIELVRDYYRVEDTNGARFWIFRAGIHGGRRAPRWYLHGLFA
jgi:protein ImuB